MENIIKSQTDNSVYVLKQIDNINEVAAEYGLYGKIINFKNDKSILGTGFYFVISMNPIEESVNPYEISKRKIRNPHLFYPYDFAVRITSANMMVVFDKVMDFCKDAEFLAHLYAEYGTKLPECIRYSELSGLKNWVDGKNNVYASDRFRSDCAKGLKTFFKNENSSFGQEKRRFFRSERYDEKAGFIQEQKDFANRESPVIRLEVLLQCADEIAKQKISKWELKRFIKYIKNVFPEVLFALSEKEVIDSGLIKATKDLPEGHPLLKQKPVTDEEFDRIIQARFATEGFNCTNDLRPAYWEFYDIYYKKVDEPQIVAAYNDIYLTFADHDPLQDIKARGPMNMIDLPIDDIHYFVALAKSKGLQFHFDHRGKYSVPSFTDIHVIYSSRDQHIINEIIDAMVRNNILTSHLVNNKKH